MPMKHVRNKPRFPGRVPAPLLVLRASAYWVSTLLPAAEFPANSEPWRERGGPRHELPSFSCCCHRVPGISGATGHGEKSLQEGNEGAEWARFKSRQRETEEAAFLVES